jgi:hypothetical protein
METFLHKLPPPMTVKRLCHRFATIRWSPAAQAQVGPCCGFLIHIKDMIEKPERLLLA